MASFAVGTYSKMTREARLRHKIALQLAEYMAQYGLAGLNDLMREAIDKFHKLRMEIALDAASKAAVNRINAALKEKSK